MCAVRSVLCAWRGAVCGVRASGFSESHTGELEGVLHESDVDSQKSDHSQDHTSDLCLKIDRRTSTGTCEHL